MHRSITLAAALAVLAPTAAEAAQDPGLTLHETHPGARRLGLGVQAAVSIPLGRGARAAAAERPTLSLRAGPSLTREGASVRVSERTRVAPLAELAVRPAHSTAWSLAGRPLAVSYATPALREAEATPDGPHSNISTVGWVAIGVGAALVVGGVLVFDHLRDIDRNSD